MGGIKEARRQPVSFTEGYLDSFGFYAFGPEEIETLKNEAEEKAKSGLTPKNIALERARAGDVFETAFFLRLASMPMENKLEMLLFAMETEVAKEMAYPYDDQPHLVRAEYWRREAAQLSLLLGQVNVEAAA